jgi:hypothetical protein
MPQLNKKKERGKRRRKKTHLVGDVGFYERIKLPKVQDFNTLIC